MSEPAPRQGFPARRRALVVRARGALHTGLELPLRRPFAAVGLVLLLSLPLSPLRPARGPGGEWTLRFAPRIDVRVEKIFPEHDPDRAVYERFRQLFGSDDVTALCALELPVPALSRAGMERIEELTRLLGQEPLVDGRELVSLSSAPLVRVMDQDTLEVAPLFEPRRAAGWDEAAIGALVREHPLFARRLISDDGRMCAFWVPMTWMPAAQRTQERRGEFVAALRRFFSPEAQGGRLRADERAHLEGFAVTNEAVYRLIQHDLARFYPLAWGAVLLGLALAFRHPAAAGLAVALMALAAAWTFGAMALLDCPVSFISTVIPVVLLVVCVSDAVHLVHGYRLRLGEGLEQPAAVRAAVHDVGPACLYTNVTSAAGFASLGWSDVEIVRELGLPLALGTLAAWLVTVLLLPPLLLWLPRLAPARVGPARGAALFARLAGFVRRRAWAVLGAWLLLALLGGALLPWLSRESRLLEAFDEGHELIVTRRLFEARLGGVAPLELLIEGREPGRVLDPQVQRALLRLEEELRGPRFQELGLLHACSLADLIADAHWTFHERAPALRGALPDTREAVAQLRFVYGLGDRDPTRDYASQRSLLDPTDVEGADEPRVLRLQMRVRNLWTSELRRLVAEVERAARAALPPDLELRTTGLALMSQAISRTLVWEMLQSLLSAAVSIGLLLVIALGSLRLGLLALVPNAIPILLVFAAMVVSGTALSLGTSVICTIMLGIVVDDTIHFLAAQRERRAHGDPDPVGSTLVETGAAIGVASGILLLGFLVLLCSAFPANRTFGALSSVTVLFAVAAELTLTPALLYLLEPGGSS